MSKIRDILISILVWAMIIVSVSATKILLQRHTAKTTIYPQKATNVGNRKILYDTKNNVTDITIIDKTTGTTNTYKIDMTSALDIMTKESKKISNNQIAYRKQNDKLVSEALSAYAFFIGIDYKFVTFCEQYYPVAKLKKNLDFYFKDKKEKAESILKNSHGTSWIKAMKNTMLSNKDAIKIMTEQAEKNYQSVKLTYYQDTGKNLTHKEYCQMFDDDDVILSTISTIDKQAKNMLPGF